MANNWNHRVWLEKFGDESCYCIKETYYNAKGEVCACTEDATAAYGETLEQLKETLERQLNTVYSVLQGTKHGVLEIEGFKFAEWDN